MIETVLLIVLVCVALALVGLVLVQQGKGADAGASFGGGASQTVFGGAGSGNFLTKSSWTLAGIFFVICLALGYLAREKAGGSGVDFAEPEVQVEQVIETDVPQYDEAAETSDVPVAPTPSEAAAVVEEASDVPPVE
jgi:preprotein translocase subunit SecG